MNTEHLADDNRFATSEARLQHQDELEDIVSAWTRTQDRFVMEDMLQARGVSAGAVRSLHEQATDPQLLHREHFIPLEHNTLGTVTVEGPRFHLSRTPAEVNSAAGKLICVPKRAFL